MKGFDEAPLRELMREMSDRLLSAQEIALFKELQEKAGSEYRFAAALVLREDVRSEKLEDQEEREVIQASLRSWREYRDALSHLSAAAGLSWFFYLKRRDLPFGF